MMCCDPGDDADGSSRRCSCDRKTQHIVSGAQAYARVMMLVKKPSSIMWPNKSSKQHWLRRFRRRNFASIGFSRSRHAAHRYRAYAQDTCVRLSTVRPHPPHRLVHRLVARRPPAHEAPQRSSSATRTRVHRRRPHRGSAGIDTDSDAASGAAAVHHAADSPAHRVRRA